jgi:cell division transport system ATP-binding protein
MLPRRVQPTVSCRGIGYRYGGHQALHDVSFDLGPGELAVLTGASAAGKTTLLRLLHGQLRPRSGRMVVLGVDAGRARGLRRRVGVVFQDHRLLSGRTALENVAYALRVSDLDLPRRQATGRALAALDQVGLGERPDAYPAELSGGQQQRVAIARALVARPALLLADEPTSNLDRESTARIVELLRGAARGGTAVLVASHEAGLIPGPGCRVLALDRGRMAIPDPGQPLLRAAR